MPAVMSGMMLALSGLAIATACAALSPLIVARRWAFVGEGVGHSSFGGAGLAWLLAAMLPNVEALRGVGPAYAGTVFATLLVAMGIGKLTRDPHRLGGRIGFDAAVGIFLTVSLAVGFLAREAYVRRFGVLPPQADALLFGAAMNLSVAEAVAAVGVALAVIAGLILFGREVLAYAFDPELAELHGVRAGLVHYGLLLAIAAIVATGARLTGAVLLPGLLILPGVTAAVLAGRLSTMWGVSLLVTLIAFGVAMTVHLMMPAIPVGPAVVLLLVVQFLIAALWAKR